MLTRLLIGVLLAQAPDAPVIRLDTPSAALLDIRPLDAGQPAPGDGVWMDTEASLATARRVKACEIERAQLRAAAPLGTALAIAVGLGAGLGLGWLLWKR